MIFQELTDMPVQRFWILHILAVVVVGEFKPEPCCGCMNQHIGVMTAGPEQQVRDIDLELEGHWLDIKCSVITRSK